jgi:hypothetical protein
MKKFYVTPKTEMIEVKSDALLAQFSSTEAASDATALSRDGGNGNWDDEE